MYECRCPHDHKKLAEIARPPLTMESYGCPCECGRWVSCRIVLEDETNNVLIVGSCPCGREIKKVIGPVVTIQCPKCKAFIQF